MAGIYGNRASPNFQEQLNLLILALKSQKLCASRIKSTNEERYKRLHHGFNVVDGRKLDQAANKPKTKRFDRVTECEDSTKKDELKAAVEKANKFKEQLKNFSFNFPQKNKDKQESVTMQMQVKGNVKNPNDNKATSSNEKWGKDELEYKVDHTYFVLDTNVLIEDLDLLESVNKLKLFGTAGSVIYIPYIVFKELDGLKQKNVTGFAARRAIEYLNDRFDYHINIGAQSAVDDLIHIVDIDNPDDSIINCCLQIQKAVPHMMLLTNDKNLRLKARASSIMVSTCLQLTSSTSRKRSSHRNRRAIRQRRRRSFI